MKKFVTLLLVGLLAASMFTGCSKSSSTGNTGSTENTVTEAPAVEDTSSDTSSDVSTEVAEVTVTHSKGTTTIPAGATKAVVFDMSILDNIQSLGIECEVAAPVSSIPTYLDSFADATNAGGIKEPDIEAIYNFEPDVIFISGRQSDYYDQLSEIAPTIYVDLEAATYVDDAKRNATYVAEIFGAEAALEGHLAELDAALTEIAELTAASDEKALIILTNDGSISAYGSGSRFGFVHDTLGVKEADETIESSTHGQEASYEYIAETNPDILFVIDRTAVVGGSVEANSTLENDLVNSTNAAKNSKIVYLDSEQWYLAGGGLTSVTSMFAQVADAFR